MTQKPIGYKTKPSERIVSYIKQLHNNNTGILVHRSDNFMIDNTNILQKHQNNTNPSLIKDNNNSNNKKMNHNLAINYNTDITLHDIEDLSKIYEFMKNELHVNKLDPSELKKLQQDMRIKQLNTEKKAEMEKEIEKYSQLSLTAYNNSYMEIFGKTNFNDNSASTPTNNNNSIQSFLAMKKPRIRQEDIKPIDPKIIKERLQKKWNSPKWMNFTIKSIYESPTKEEKQLKDMIIDSHNTVNKIRGSNCKYVMNMDEKTFFDQYPVLDKSYDFHENAYKREFIISLKNSSPSKPHIKVKSLLDKLEEKCRYTRGISQENDIKKENHVDRVLAKLNEFNKRRVNSVESKKRSKIQMTIQNTKKYPHLKSEKESPIILSNLSDYTKTSLNDTKRLRALGYPYTPTTMELKEMKYDLNTSRAQSTKSNGIRFTFGSNSKYTDEGGTSTDMNERVINRPNTRGIIMNNSKMFSYYGDNMKNLHRKAFSLPKSQHNNFNVENNSLMTKMISNPSISNMNDGNSSSFLTEINLPDKIDQAHISRHEHDDEQVNKDKDKDKDKEEETNNSLIKEREIFSARITSRKRASTLWTPKLTSRSSIEEIQEKIIKQTNEFAKTKRIMANRLDNALQALKRDRVMTNKLRFMEYRYKRGNEADFSIDDARSYAESIRKEGYKKNEKHILWYNNLVETVEKSRLPEEKLKVSIYVLEIIRDIFESGNTLIKSHFNWILEKLEEYPDINELSINILTNIQNYLNIKDDELSYKEKLLLKKIK